MATQAILKENEQGLLAQSYKVENLKEMKIICSLLTFIHQEINDYEQLYSMTSAQYTNQLFKNTEFEENIKNNLLEYSSKLKAYRNVANTITQLLADKGD